MDINMDFDLFAGDGFEVQQELLSNLPSTEQYLLTGMMTSGHYTETGLNMSKFLRDDLSIDLEKLELAVATLVHAMEINLEDDATLNICGMDGYYSLRGIVDNEKQIKEEKSFILAFISRVAMNESVRDTIHVVILDEN
jgi:hypothetical protein